MNSALRHSVIALLLTAVAGCGQMGPLYLPGEDPAPVNDDSAPVAENAEPAADAAKPDDDEG